MQYIILTAITALTLACARGYPVSGAVIGAFTLLALWEIVKRMDYREALLKVHQEKKKQEDAERRNFLGQTRMELRKSA